MRKFGRNKSKDPAGDNMGMMTSDFDFPASEEEEEAEEATPRLDVKDEGDQVALDEPLRYMSVRKSTFRLSSSLDSEEVGKGPKGTIVLVTHTKELPCADGKARLRFRCERGSALPGKGSPAGWVSATASSGSCLFIKEGSQVGASATGYYKTLDEVPVLTDATHNSAEVEGAALAADTVFEALEVQEVKKDKNQLLADKFVKCEAGWILYKAGSKQQLKRLNFADPAGDKELKTAGKVARKEAKSGSKSAQSAQKQLLQFEAQLNKMILEAPDNEHHPVQETALVALNKALQLVQAQTAEFDDDEDGGDDDDN